MHRFLILTVIALLLTRPAPIYAQNNLVFLEDEPTYYLRADGKDSSKIKVQLKDKVGKPVGGTTVNVANVHSEGDSSPDADTADVKLLDNEAVTDANGNAVFYIQSLEQPGVARLKIESAFLNAEKSVRTVRIDLADPWQPSVARVFSVLPLFVLIMLLVSIFTEKLVDIVKSYYVLRYPGKVPLATFNSMFGLKYEYLLTAMPDQIERIWTLLKVKPEHWSRERHRPFISILRYPKKGTFNSSEVHTVEDYGAEKPPNDASKDIGAPRSLGAMAGLGGQELVTGSAVVDANYTNDTCNLLAAIRRADLEREIRESWWAWRWRWHALVVGFAIAVVLDIDALEILSPLTSPAHRLKWYGLANPWVGFVLTGCAAAIGAPFWQDLLDRLTAWKKAAELNAQLPSPASGAPSLSQAGSAPDTLGLRIVDLKLPQVGVVDVPTTVSVQLNDRVAGERVKVTLSAAPEGLVHLAVSEAWVERGQMAVLFTGVKPLKPGNVTLTARLGASSTVEKEWKIE